MIRTLSALLLLVPLATAAPDAAAPPPATPAAPAATGPVNDVAAANGVHLSADLRSDYVAGFPMLVRVTVRNEGDAPVSFPDLQARPHLVRFHMKRGTVKWERFTTPPATDPPTTWTIQPRGQKQVLLEIPSSGGLDPGDWELGLTVADPAGALTLPNRVVRLAAAKPVGGSYTWESTIQQTNGAVVPWVQPASSGFDLYLLHLDPRSPTRARAQYHLAHLPTAVDPVLTRARPTDVFSRYVYWAAGSQGVTLARLEGTTLRAKPRTFTLPYPKIELLGRGATDAKGGVIVPIWVPDPTGAAGAVKALCVDDRGAHTLRDITRLPARPPVVATTVDAGSNLVLALGHPAGVDVYRIDPTLAEDIGARGARVSALADGWAPAALGFDSLPDRGDRPGGLALLALLTRSAPEGNTYRTFWSDLSGRVFDKTDALPWAAPGDVASFLPQGRGPFYVLTRDAQGAYWYGAQGAPITKVDGATGGTLWPSSAGIQLRRIADRTVVDDRLLGPLLE